MEASNLPTRNLHPVEIRGLILDPVNNTPIVILKKPEENVYLPIWIGVFEANAIALQLEGVQPPRPMTHDLLRSTVQALGATVEGEGAVRGTPCRTYRHPGAFA